MVPRATAEQAVNLLKVYQLRRENAAIHGEVLGLQDAVQDLKHSQKTFQQENQKDKEDTDMLKASIAKQQDKLKQLEDAFSTYLKVHDTTSNTINARQDDFDVNLKEIRQEQVELCQTLILVRDQQDQHVQSIEHILHDHASLAEQSTKINAFVDARGNGRKLQCLSDEVDIKPLTSLLHEQSLVSRIEDSIKIDVNLPNGEARNDTQDDASTESELDLDEIQSISTESDVPNDIDLDEPSIPAQHDECLVPASYPPEVVSQSQSALRAKPQQLLSEVLALEQVVGESLVEYFERVSTLQNNLPPVASNVLLFKFIECMSNDQAKLVYAEWLDGFGWTWDNLRAIMTLQPHERAMFQSKSRGLQTNSQETGFRDAMATRIVQPSPKEQIADMQHGNDMSLNAPTKAFEPRRSKRIAEQLETQSNEVKLTENQEPVKNCSQRVRFGDQKDNPGAPQPIYTRSDAISIRTKDRPKRKAAAQTSTDDANVDNVKVYTQLPKHTMRDANGRFARMTPQECQATSRPVTVEKKGQRRSSQKSTKSIRTYKHRRTMLSNRDEGTTADTETTNRHLSFVTLKTMRDGANSIRP